MKKYLTYFAVILITATTFAACSKSRLVNTNWERTNVNTLFDGTTEEYITGINFTSKTEFNLYEIFGGQKDVYALGTYTYDGKRSGKFKYKYGGESVNYEDAFTIQGNHLSSTVDGAVGEEIYTKK